MKPSKILIIKLGFSETLCPEISRESSLGDIVRTTVLLNYFKERDIVYWLVDEKAAPLLENNPRINKVLIWNHPEVILQLQREKFDMVVNLEKTPGLCALSDSIDAHRKCGFRFNEWDGVAEANYHTERVLAIAQSEDKRNSANMYWQQHLARVIDKRWSRSDRYIMSKPVNPILYDIGLNYQVGSKWPDKAWDMKNWYDLHYKLHKLGYNVSPQNGLDSLNNYMQWVNACRTIITCDSLGLHLALAYGKYVISLFGPSPSKEVYLYKQGDKIVAKDGKMSSITVERVLSKLKEPISEE
jgi:heptosyltransferase II